MSEWKARVFWTDVTTHSRDGGIQIELDGKPVKTPAKAALALPTPELADVVAQEWRAQVGTIDPGSMPYTRMANVAIDKVAFRMPQVRAHVLEYAQTDLLCYRAAGPSALVDRQADVWDPLLGWFAGRTGAALATGVGVMPVAQDVQALEKIAKTIDGFDPFQLAAFSEMVSLGGSFVIALGVAERHITAPQGWAASRIDEDFQTEQWGYDEDANILSSAKRADFERAAAFFAGI